MRKLEKQIKRIAQKNGAALVGISSRDRLSDAPPSGDPGYLLPSTQSVISFAIPYDQTALKDFFSKTGWRAFNLNKKKNTRQLYVIGDHLVNFLKNEGADALAVEVNNNYRPEPNAKNMSEMVEMIPEFSHRYGAVAAGLGRLGWSGNLMTPQYGSAVLLGTVLTSAKLDADPVLEVNPCDKCKLCAVSCPVGMISGKESIKVKIAGVTEEIAKKKTNNCCWIGCDGYHSLSSNKKWSNWSPYRLEIPFPENDAAVDELCTQIRKSDPDANAEDVNLYSDYRKAFFDPDYLFVSVCAHCANICWPEREDRIENRKRIASSGIVVLRANGERAVVKDDKEVVEVRTPFNLNVAFLREEYDAAMAGKIRIEEENAATQSDKMVLELLRTQNLSESPEPK